MDQVPVFMTFGERLTWWIERRGITQAELGRAAGISPSTVNELCKGESSQPRAAAAALTPGLALAQTASGWLGGVADWRVSIWQAQAEAPGAHCYKKSWLA